jgi:cation:H+ antiporter
MKKELPALLGVSAICFVVFADFTLNYFDGILLLFLAVVFMWRVLKNPQVLNKGEEGEVGTIIDPKEVSEDFIGEMSTPKAFALLFFGLILLIISSNILVEGARTVAITLGVSELIIGLTIMAIGTSLPELATSLTSALKGHYDLVLGTIIGSNIMNILLVLPVPSLISPFVFQPEVLTRDYATMMIITLGCASFLYIRSRKKQRVGRVAGAVLLATYIAYTALLIISP